MARDGETYAGAYAFDKVAETVSGCPARAATIESFMKVIKRKSGVKGAAATRHHAEAMRIEELKKLMMWSEAQCLPEMLEKVAQAKDLKTLLLVIKHGLMQAFMPSG